MFAHDSTRTFVAGCYEWRGTS